MNICGIGVLLPDLTLNSILAGAHYCCTIISLSNKRSQVRNLFDSVEKLTWFLSGSAKRKQLFWKVLLSVALKEIDDQQLVDLLTENDEGD